MAEQPLIPRSSVSLVSDNDRWIGSAGAGVPLTGDSIVVGHFVNTERATRELQLETGADHYRVSVTLRGSELLAHHDGKLAYDGRTTAGMVHIAEPNTRLTAVVNSPGEALHLFVPTRLVERLGEDAGRPRLALKKTVFQSNASLAFMARAIADHMEDTSCAGRFYVESLCGAAAGKLIGDYSNRVVSPVRDGDGLSAWRLRKVREHVDAHLEGGITLKDMAAVAGLSQMHFARQFRRACGRSPHEYLLERRIERAKTLLLGAPSSLLEVALSVGFASHPHFTTTFKRLVGGTPAEWRRLRALR